MRIRSLSIDGFGLFHDAEIADLSPGLNLVLGDNEAGKSTTMAFVHAILFGFADGRSKGPSYPPLRGGQHGGRLRLDTERQGILTVERSPGPKGGRLRIQSAGGDLLDAAALERALGGVDAKLYRTLYGFSLSELQSFESIASEDVRDVIYGASLGTGLRTLPAARKKLADRAADLFKKGGSKPEINQRLRSLEDVRNELVDAQLGLQRFEDIHGEIERLGSEIDRLSETLQTRRVERERTRALLKAWGSWQALRDARRTLDGLEPQVERFPEQGLIRLDKLEQDLANERRECADANLEFEGQRDRLAQLVYDAPLLAVGAEVTELFRGLDAFDRANQERPTALRRSKEKSEDVDEVLAQLGRTWNEERTLALDRSPHARESIGAHRKRLEEASETLRRAAQVFADAGENRNRAAETCAELEEKLAEDDPQGLDADPASIQPLRDGRATFADVLRDLPLRRRELADAEKAFEATLREIDPSWTAETLDGLDTSLQAQHRIEAADTEGTTREAELHTATEARQRAETDLRKIDVRLETRRDELTRRAEVVSSAADEGALGDLRERARTLRNEAQQLDGARIQLAGLEARQEDARIAGTAPADSSLGGKLAVMAIVIGLAGVAGAAALVLGGDLAGGIGVGLGSLFITGILLWLRSSGAGAAAVSPMADVRARLQTLQRDIANREQALRAGLETLRLDPELVRGEASDLVTKIEHHADALGELLRLAEDVSALAKDQEEAVAEFEAAAAGVTTAGQALEAQRSSWRTHVRALSLPEDTSPRTATLVFGKAEKARSERQRAQDVQRRIDGMEASRQSFRAALAKIPRLAAHLDGDESNLLAELITFLGELDQHANRLRDRDKQRARLDDARAVAARQEEALEVARTDQDEAQTAFEIEQSAWRSWLEAAGMDPDWSTETAKHALDRADRLYELARDRDDEAARAEERQDEVEEYRARAAQLFTRLDLPVPPESDLTIEIQRLSESHRKNEELRTRHEQLAETVERSAKGLEGRKRRIGELEGELGSLLEEAGCQDAEAFREKAQTHESRQMCEQEIERAEEAIRRATDAETLSEVEPELAETSQDQLLARVEELEGEIEHADATHGGLVEKRGQATQERDSLHSKDRISDLRAREESLREELDLLAREWARHSIAEHLLDVAKERHAKANQPKVIQEAGRYFERITDRRYTRVFAPPGEHRIEVRDAQDRPKDAADLSRGSAEQLYLAIRFGYISAQAAGSEPLPVLMDDVLVNFDPRRAAAAARSIVELSRERQVLFFTCHPSVVDVFREFEAQVPLYRIEDGDLRAADQ